MPGKHAPASPLSFYISVARAAAVGLAAIGIVVGIIVVAVRSGEEPQAVRSPTPSPSPGSTQSPSPRATSTPTSKSDVTIVVLNGTPRAGLARGLATRLEDHGYTVLKTGNAPSTQRTTIYFNSGGRSAALQIRRAELRFLDPDGVKPADPSTPADLDALVTIVIGSDYPT